MKYQYHVSTNCILFFLTKQTALLAFQTRSGPDIAPTPPIFPSQYFIMGLGRCTHSVTSCCPG
jgi:hypothetical protein